MVRHARVPPGRAGRTWLRRRLATAEHGREQLDHKLRALLPELDRRRLLAEQHRRAWVRAWSEAGTWTLRAAVLGGHDALAAAAATSPAVVEVAWAVEMGVDYPVDVHVVRPGGAEAVPASVAGVLAGRAHRTALEEALHCAATEEAVRRVEAEVAATRRRLRALDKKLLPWLRQELAARDLGLEQSEQEDLARVRRLVGPAVAAGGRGDR